MIKLTQNTEPKAADDAALILPKLKDFYEQGASASAYKQWQQEAKTAWNFYDGQQWTAEERAALQEVGQAPIVINKLASKIDSIAGTEVEARTRILFRSRSGNVGEEQTARALTDLALYVSEQANLPQEVSNVFKAGLVTGIGWLDVSVENAPEGVRIIAQAEDEMSVVFDPLSRRADLSDSRFVARERWLSADELQRLFPDTAGQAGLLLSGAQARGIYQSPMALGTTNYIDSERGLVRVVEVQYKQTELRFRVKRTDGSEYLTFDKKQAYAQAGATVSSEYAPRIYVGYFADNVLLSHAPLALPIEGFTLIPYVYKRAKSDGRPYGLVQSAIDPQRELNKRRSKAMHLLNTAQVIADIDAVDDPNLLAKEAARPDGMILKRPGKELRILRNSDLAGTQVSVMEQAGRDIQEVLGVFDEVIGKESNATSGIAIRTRQLAGTRNQLFAFDALRQLKSKLGRYLLSLMRQYFTDEMVIRITDDLNAPRNVKLNEKIRLANGETITVRDVRLGQFDIVVEEVGDVLSGRQVELEQLALLMQSGVPVPPEMLINASNLKQKDMLLNGLNGAKNNL